MYHTLISSHCSWSVSSSVSKSEYGDLEPLPISKLFFLGKIQKCSICASKFFDPFPAAAAGSLQRPMQPALPAGPPISAAPIWSILHLETRGASSAWQLGNSPWLHSKLITWHQHFANRNETSVCCQDFVQPSDKTGLVTASYRIGIVQSSNKQNMDSGRHAPLYFRI